MNKTQIRADRNTATRKYLSNLAAEIEKEVNHENSLAVDEPEGVVVVRLDMSLTLARELIGQLRRAQALI